MTEDVTLISYRSINPLPLLLRSGLRQGSEIAVLTVAGDNAPAIRLYEDLGFHPDCHIRWYAKPLDG